MTIDGNTTRRSCQTSPSVNQTARLLPTRRPDSSSALASRTAPADRLNRGVHLPAPETQWPHYRIVPSSSTEHISVCRQQTTLPLRLTPTVCRMPTSCYAWATQWQIHSVFSLLTTILYCYGFVNYIYHITITILITKNSNNRNKKIKQ